MRNLLKQAMFFSFAIGSCGLAAFGGESIVYQFDGWKVTVTPGRSKVKPDAPIPAATESSPSARRERSVVTPVVFVDTNPSPVALTPDDAKLASTTRLNPPNPDAQLSLPPSPPPEAPVPVDIGSGELPVITPRSPDKAPQPGAAVIPPQVAMYRDIYSSIPFNRAEYNAYPSYRHDATMELLFNQMRNTVIQRGTTNVYHYDMNYGGSIYTPYYPYNYGLRIHSSR
jgi:hypothetical protein